MSVSLIKLIHKLAWILPPAVSQTSGRQHKKATEEESVINLIVRSAKTLGNRVPADWVEMSALHCIRRCTALTAALLHFLYPVTVQCWCGGSCDDAISLVFCVTPLIECGVFNMWPGAELRLWGDDGTLHCIHYTLHLDTVERVSSPTEYQAWFFGLS